VSRRKPGFVDEYSDWVKLIDVVEGLAIATEIPICAKCSVPGIEGAVTLDTQIQIHPSLIEDLGIQQRITLRREFSDFHHGTSGTVEVTFLANENGIPVLSNNEAKWEPTDNNSGSPGLRLNDGRRVEQKTFSRGGQVCVDGILVAGCPGRTREIRSLGEHAPGFYLSGPFVLDARGDVKPDLTPARTPPRWGTETNRSWQRLSDIAKRAEGSIWEEVLQHVPAKLSNLDFWRFLALYNGDILSVSAGELWQHLPIPFTTAAGEIYWQSFDTIPELHPVRVDNKIRLRTVDSNLLGPNEAILGWSANNYRHHLMSSCKLAVALLCVASPRGEDVALRAMQPANRAEDLRQYLLGTIASRLALRFQSEYENLVAMYSSQGIINRQHPLIQEVIRARYNAKPSQLTEFARGAVYALSDQKNLVSLERGSITRHLKWLASKYSEVDWSRWRDEYKPPYCVLLKSGKVLTIQDTDFAGWLDEPLP